MGVVSSAHFSKAASTMWKVILVTGGNKGIGLAIVEALLQEVEDSIVLLGSRDAVRGQQAVDGVVGKLGKQFRPWGTFGGELGRVWARQGCRQLLLARVGKKVPQDHREQLHPGLHRHRPDREGVL